MQYDCCKSEAKAVYLSWHTKTVLTCATNQSDKLFPWIIQSKYLVCLYNVVDFSLIYSAFQSKMNAGHINKVCLYNIVPLTFG